MTRVSGPWLDDPATQAVMAMLSGGGHQALAVGGCVRNALLGLPVADVDIATDALPERVMDLAQGAGLRAVGTGLAHGTVTVVAGGRGFEVTTFRRDAETFGRQARVAFDATLAQDAGRRDFTMNALYCIADGTVIDPLGGLPDARARRLRFVGDAGARVAEDYLRILRFFRFLAWYADPALPPDSDALAACAAGVPGLAQVSGERVGQEMRKLLAAPAPGPAVAAMAGAGVLEAVLPGADAGALARLLVLEPTPGGWLRRLAALGGDAQGLRLSRTEARDLDRLGAVGAEGAGELGYRLGAALGWDAALVRAARQGGPLPPQAGVARGAAAVFPLKAAHLSPPLSGPKLGRALTAAESWWIAQDFAPDLAALRAYALGI